MKSKTIVATDPFTFEREIHREEVRRLNAEIIRLKLKCGEEFTAREIFGGFGDPPDVYVHQLPKKDEPRV